MTEQRLHPAGPLINPWEQRGELGWKTALRQALMLFLVSPRRGFEGTQGRGGFRGPLLFALLVSLTAGLLSALAEGLYELITGPEGSGSLSELFEVSVSGETVQGLEWVRGSLLGLFSAGGCIVGLAVGVPIFLLMFPLIMLVWSGLLHFCLRLVGGLKSSGAGYQGTWAAICYATVAFLGGVLPVIGDWVVFLWLGLLQGIGFWRLHRTTRVRAALALLLPFMIPLTLWLMKSMGLLGEP